MPSRILDILHRCKLFSALQERGFQHLFEMAQVCTFQKREIVFHEGDACPGMFVVDSGLVRIFKIGSAGKEHVLHMAGPGNTFAEIAAIGGFECPAIAEAVAPTSCVLLPLDLFQTALKTDHELCLGMMTGLTFWVRHLVGLMEGIVLRDAAGRLALFLLESSKDSNGTFELPGLKRYVASHLNLTSETFSRLLRRFTDAEMISELANGRYRILDAKRLQLVVKGFSPKI